MTNDEIIEMAMQSGFGPAAAWEEVNGPIITFARLIAKRQTGLVIGIGRSIIEKHFDPCEPWLEPDEFVEECESILAQGEIE